MATKKKEAQDLTQAAAKYKEIVLQIKDLEKTATPLKKSLLAEAAKLELDTLAIGAVTIEKRVSKKEIIDQTAITPDWLYRAQQAGLDECLDIKVKNADSLPSDLWEEVHYSTYSTTTYAVRI
ncbi:MAG: hypothetical protein LBN27_03565 [Prevotellaceae bacterium]|jgi:hypothetical protein|nr:hypothetical protein [Prevotellaceae bacterium]